MKTNFECKVSNSYSRKHYLHVIGLNAETSSEYFKKLLSDEKLDWNTVVTWEYIKQQFKRKTVILRQDCDNKIVETYWVTKQQMQKLYIRKTNYENKKRTNENNGSDEPAAKRRKKNNV